MEWWQRRRREDDLERELQAHLDLETAEQRERGLPEAESAAAARRALGNRARVAEEVREAWGWTWLERLAQDLRYGIRLLRRNPVFSLVAVLTLALGIGANAAIFSLIDAVLLKPLPVRNPRELWIVAKQAEGGVAPAFYYETYDRLRKEQPFFRELAAYSPVRLNVSVDGEPESSMGQLVSGNYYSVLGVNAVAGRTFTADDDQVPGGHPVAMISYQYWRRRFGMERSAIGKKVLIDGTPFTIAGVTPPDFFGVEVGSSPDVSVPVMMQRQVMPQAENWLGRSTNTVDWLRIFGRLRPGVTAAQAASGMAVMFSRIQTQLAQEIDANWHSTWLKEWAGERLVLVSGATGLSTLRRQFSKPLFVLMGVVALVLLIACSNVANLLLARAVARRREIALRMAMGASRMRLVRQLLAESLLLAVLGGALGIVFAFWGSALLVHFLSAGGPAIRLDLAPDWRVLGFTAAISAATGILFGLAPAARAAGMDLGAAVQQGGRATSPRQRFGRALAAAQVTLSLVLVVGAGLLSRTLQKLDDVDPGFARDRVFTVGLAPRGSDQKNGPNAPRLHRLYLDLQERVQAIPGVIAASFAGLPPTMQLQPRTFTTADGRQFRGSWTQVYPRFFAALGAPVLRGRDFSAADMAEGAPFVAVINETLARRVFPNEDPIGQRIVCNRTSACQVIGVVRDIAYSTLKRGPESTVYQTFLQAPTGRGQMELQVRFAGDPVAVAAQVRREVAAIDPNLPAFVIRTLADEVDAALVRERLLALLSTAFGALAVLLAGIGLYGVIAYSVGRRTQEIGVRVALGASRGEVWRLVVGEALWIAGLGIACGLPMALAATRLIAGFLYGVKASDLAVLAGSAAFLAIIGMVAGCMPASRAARIDPMTALRHE